MRPEERFRARDDDFNRRRVVDLLRELVVADRRDCVFLAFPADPARVLRLALDFVIRPRFRGVLETAFELFITLRTVRLAAGARGCPFSAAVPTTAPTIPPTTAPIGPARLPAAAPVTAPAVCFRIGGIWIFLDYCEFSSSLLVFGFSGINFRLP